MSDVYSFAGSSIQLESDLSTFIKCDGLSADVLKRLCEGAEDLPPITLVNCLDMKSGNHIIKLIQREKLNLDEYRNSPVSPALLSMMFEGIKTEGSEESKIPDHSDKWEELFEDLKSLIVYGKKNTLEGTSVYIYTLVELLTQGDLRYTENYHRFYKHAGKVRFQELFCLLLDTYRNKETSIEADTLQKDILFSAACRCFCMAFDRDDDVNSPLLELLALVSDEKKSVRDKILKRLADDFTFAERIGNLYRAKKLKKGTILALSETLSRLESPPTYFYARL